MGLGIFGPVMEGAGKNCSCPLPPAYADVFCVRRLGLPRSPGQLVSPRGCVRPLLVQGDTLEVPLGFFPPTRSPKGIPSALVTHVLGALQGGLEGPAARPEGPGRPGWAWSPRPRRG